MRVVILGAGFAGLTAARELERTLPASVEILLVDRHNYFLFTPLLAEAATGMVDPGRVVVPLRSFLNRAVTQQAEVTGVDPDRRRVVLRHGAAFSPHDHQVSYDHLVIALGSTTNFFGLPGLEEHAYGFKSLGDALTLRNRVLDALEQADMDADPPRRESLLTFVVGGGAFSGVEIAGALADFVGSAARHYRNLRARDIRILLVEMKDRLLPELPAEMGRFAGEVLTRKGVEIRLQTKVEAAEDGRVVLGGGQAIPTHTLVWTSGVMPPPIVEGFSLPRDEKGWLVADSTLQAQGHRDVWVLGDCAAIPAPGEGIYPPTAQHAMPEGKHLARNIARSLADERPEAFRHRTKGMLISLGHSEGLAEVKGWQAKGVAGWLLWRGFYFARIPTVSRKLRLAGDWLLNSLTGPDLAEIPLWARVEPEVRQVLESPAGEPHGSGAEKDG